MVVLGAVALCVSTCFKLTSTVQSRFLSQTDGRDSKQECAYVTAERGLPLCSVTCFMAAGGCILLRSSSLVHPVDVV